MPVVTVSVTARAVAGTTPIYVDLDITATDRDTGERVFSRSKTLVITDLTIPETYMDQFTGEPGRTYLIEATATFRNDYGQDIKTASKEVTIPIPGEPPKGEISLEVTVT